MRLLYYINRFIWEVIGIIDEKHYARHYGVKIGDNCLFDTKNIGSEPYLITIGNNVQITHNVSFHTHGGGHVARGLYPDFDVFGKIVVCDNAYVGSNAQIMPGVTIGEGALVAAGSVVTKSVPPHIVVGGNPARVLCTVQEYIDKNNRYNVHTKGMTEKKKKEVLMSLPSNMFITK